MPPESEVTAIQATARQSFHAERIDDADNFVSRHKGYLGCIWVVTTVHGDISEPTAGGKDFDADLTRYWFAQVIFDDL
jgi:hypothetical protein